ncbi:TPA: hypothetical protein N0F65_000722 [Lagenidium giganteum]|uniref:Protein XRP2 n=1 Tax=Lagenidium giganteum TaxID=4803 RepID=A0AAV2ZHM3_9STRA|nr:TPA: hypothetical protein N0F65_000722 [Lagenidium giganteum]
MGICHSGPAQSPSATANANANAAGRDQAGTTKTLTFGRDPNLKREDFIFAHNWKRDEKCLVKLPGTINGQQFLIEECRDCDIFLFDHCSSVQIDECTNCRIFVGPCQSSLFLRNCKQCTLVCAVQQFRSRDCEDVDVYLYSSTEPIIETSKRMRFGCFSLTYFSMAHHLEQAKFSPWNNRWSEVYNFNQDHGPWKAIPMEPCKSPLEDAFHARADGFQTFWNLPSATVEAVGLSADCSQLVVPMTAGIQARGHDKATTIVLFLLPKQLHITELINAVANKSVDATESTLLIRTRQVKLTADQAKTLFPKNPSFVHTIAEATKTTAGSVVLEFAGNQSQDHVQEALRSDSFTGDKATEWIYVSENPARAQFISDHVFRNSSRSLRKARENPTVIMTTVTPQKRSHGDDSLSSDRSAERPQSSTEAPRSAKRSRRSRWEDNEEQPSESSAFTTPSKSSLSDIVKKLSSVVKEKSTPGMTSPAVPNALAIANALSAASTTNPVDAATAKAKALAQASLLSMNLPSAQVSANDLARRLYIGNLYYELKEEDIRNAFAPFGAIRSIDLSMEPGCGRSKGFCFLEYDDVLAAESAVQVLNGVQLSNRVIRVGRPLRGNISNDTTQALTIGQQAIKSIRTKCIYVGGVRTELNSHHLESIFAPFGTINACVMTAVSPLESGLHRGYGFIEFSDETSAANAIQHMHGFELAGQHLKVGKASAAAILINLATSRDKIVRGGLASVAGAEAEQTPKKKSVLDEDEDYEGGGAPAALKRCLCLMNLVNKGEVDDELEGEVRQECTKFGVVEMVEIKELADHVRVFVVFADEAGAMKGKQALHGRFFGGNQVKALFYPLHQLRMKHYEGEFL